MAAAAEQASRDMPEIFVSTFALAELAIPLSLFSTLPDAGEATSPVLGG